MANTRSYSLGPGLSKAEQIAGFCYLPVYVALLGFALAWLNEKCSLGLTDLQINIAYFLINCIFTWLIFHIFLLRSFRNIRFWDLVQALILGFVLYYVGNLLLSLLVGWLGIEIPQFNNEAVMGLAAQNEAVMIVCAVVLAPMVEETLMRGLVFGTIRRKSRILAYVVSMLLFAAIHVWQFAFLYDWRKILLAAVAYLPAGIALGWTYEKANTIWAPILLHMTINAISFGLMRFLEV